MFIYSQTAVGRETVDWSVAGQLRSREDREASVRFQPGGRRLVQPRLDPVGPGWKEPDLDAQHVDQIRELIVPVKIFNSSEIFV